MPLLYAVNLAPLLGLFHEACCAALLGWYGTQGPLKMSAPNHYLQQNKKLIKGYHSI